MTTSQMTLRMMTMADDDLRPERRSKLAEVLADDINDQDDLQDKHAELYAPFVTNAGAMVRRFLKKLRGSKLTEARAKKVAEAVINQALLAHTLAVEDIRNHALGSFEAVTLELARADQDKVAEMPMLTREDRDTRRKDKGDAD